ncbi:MAG: hypothetical protein KA974_08485 [Saprospiraceae bacterium]|nr:hypothetical protein [Saprospiraceae bacterium]MBP7699187.1 hypothetical protein [Saprospiraceae bacterium]
MKKILAIIICIFVCFNAANAQNLQIRYKSCTQCDDGLDADNTSNFTYLDALLYPTNQVADDYGPRQNGTDLYDWHGGIDYNSGNSNTDFGDLIIVPEGGTIVGSLTDAGLGYKRLIVRGATCNLGYGHMFLSTSDGFSRSGGCILKYMTPPNADQRCIIRINNGDTTAIGSTTGMVNFNNKNFPVSNTIAAGTAIGPTGYSGLTGGAHLHLFSVTNNTASTHDTVTKNPLQYVSYAQPNFSQDSIQLRNITNYANNTSVAWATPNYPGSGYSPIVVRPHMLNQGANSNRYNVINDVNKVQLLIKKYNTSDTFALIKGSRWLSEIRLGGRIGESMLPDSMYKDGSTTNGGPEYIGNLTRMGIRPFAYATTGARPYDDYYFPDFITRIHKNDVINVAPIQLAGCPQDARYNDGRYQIKAKVTDVRNQRDSSSVTTFLLDNFKPFLSRIEVNVAFQNILTATTSCCTSGGIQRSFSPAFPITLENTLFQISPLQLNVTASEPLSSLRVRVGSSNWLNMNHSTTDSTGFSLILQPASNWYDIYVAGADVIFQFDGTDLSNNHTLNISDNATSCKTIPIRASNTTWGTAELNSGLDTAKIFVACTKSLPEASINYPTINISQECQTLSVVKPTANMNNGSICFEFENSPPINLGGWQYIVVQREFITGYILL